VSKPVLFGFTFANDWDNYFLIYAFVILVIVLSRRVVQSKVGRALMAIRDSERAAEAAGVDLTRYKLFAFFISAVLAGLAGVLFAHTMRFISTDHFDILLSIYFVIMGLVGGLGSIYGAVLGTVFIVLLDFLFIPLFKDWLALFFSIEVADIQSLIFGLIMFLFIIFQPMGLYGMWLKLRIYWKLFPFNPRKKFT
jgi:branched-chain amino acid transport system permease protein